MAVGMIGGPRLCEPLLATGLGLDRYRPEDRDRLFEHFMKTMRATVEAKAKDDAARRGH